METETHPAFPTYPACAFDLADGWCHTHRQHCSPADAIGGPTEAPAERAVCAHWPAWMSTAPARCLACEYVPTSSVEHRDELCQCRRPDCGQCTELVDKGIRRERLPRYPR